jgi:hypothetical protein
MKPEQKAAFINAQIALFNCRVESMKTLNRLKEFHGEPPFYTEVHFTDLEREFTPVLGHNEVIAYFRD